MSRTTTLWWQIYLEKGERFATSKRVRKMYDDLENAGVFKNHPQLFLTGLAVGILTGKTSTEPAVEDMIRLETYVDSDPYGVFPTYLVGENPGCTPKELARIMEKYADGGIEIINQQFKSTGKVDFAKLKELGSN